ncbi:MAG TPA: MBL fold metallo-hydrolase [Actinomycetota bacterium]|nr:MBL fold metallo-hydrolase [Actinomycetota bacterium]
MRVTVLGSSGAYPAAGGAASGYLLEHDGFRVALDFGTGALSNLQRHVAAADLDAIVLSHEHMDHCLDLYPMFIARFFVDEPLPPLPLWAPPGAFDGVAVLEDDGGREQMRGVYDLHEVEAGSEFEVGPFRISTKLLPHWVPDSGMRIAADGAVLTYTGDTGPSEEIEAIARDADLLIVEASWQDADLESGKQPFHLTARQAAEHAKRAEARRTMLSHFWPGSDRDRSREQAAEAYDGELLLAQEGMTVEVRG